MNIQNLELSLKDLADNLNSAIEVLNISKLIQYLNKKREGFENLIIENNDLKRNVIILKNGRNIDFLNGINTEIHEQDVISFFPPVGGG